MVEESSVSFDAYDASLKNSIFQHGSGDGISPELIRVSSSPPMPVSTKSGFSSEIQFKAVNTPYQSISSYTLHTYWLDNDSSATDENGLQTEEETVLFSNLSFLASLVYDGFVARPSHPRAPDYRKVTPFGTEVLPQPPDMKNPSLRLVQSLVVGIIRDKAQWYFGSTERTRQSHWRLEQESTVQKASNPSDGRCAVVPY